MIITASVTMAVTMAVTVMAGVAGAGVDTGMAVRPAYPGGVAPFASVTGIVLAVAI